MLTRCRNLHGKKLVREKAHENNVSIQGRSTDDR